MVSALRPNYSGKSTTRRANSPGHTPIEPLAKLLADIYWEKAMKLADVLAPEHPLGAEKVDPREEWLMLEEVAMELSVAFWDEPDAIQSLIDLRRKFAPQMRTDHLATWKKQAVLAKRNLPDITKTPVNPEYAQQMRRMGAHPTGQGRVA